MGPGDATWGHHAACRRTADPHGEPRTLRHVYFFPRMEGAFLGRDFLMCYHAAVLDELHLIKRYSRDDLHLQTRMERLTGRHLNHRAHRLTVHTEAKERPI